MEELKAEARERGPVEPVPARRASTARGCPTRLRAARRDARALAASPPRPCNCSAPDTGNMEVLHLFGTRRAEGAVADAAARRRDPLGVRHDRARRRVSDATNIELRIERDGDEYVLNGRKWWISGACHPQLQDHDRDGQDRPRRAARTPAAVDDPRADGHPGRDASCATCRVFGYDDQEGHGELEFEDVRVPATNLIAEEGDGFTIAQARLGPGRIHHCMRAIGAGRAGARADVHARASRASRSASRSPTQRRRPATGSPSRASRSSMARLLTLKAAWLMDTVGNRQRAHRDLGDQGGRAERRAEGLDRAIQVHGGGGRLRRLRRSPRRTRTCARCASPTAPTRSTSSRSRGASSRPTSRASPPPGERRTATSAEGRSRVSVLVYRERPAHGEAEGLLVLHHGAAPTSTTCCRSATRSTRARLHVVTPARAADAPGLARLSLVPGGARRATRSPRASHAARAALAELHDELFSRTGLAPGGPCSAASRWAR